MVHKLAFQDTGFFSKTVVDYLNKKESINSFYGNFQDLKGFKKQIELLESVSQDRVILPNVLEEQYKGLEVTEKTILNISRLRDNTTFTITTGHQLNLFTGPLYFIYKILSVINICETLKSNYPEYNFVPIYWMATEDHDFDEINYFNFKENKVQWDSEYNGAVGRFSTEGLEQVYNKFSSLLNDTENARELKSLFKNAYLGFNTLAKATRYLVNKLFGSYGLVCLDADDKRLKDLFGNHIKAELIKHICFNEVSKTVCELSKNYKIQVNPREINLFYLVEGLRARIYKKENIYYVNNTSISFTQEEILKEVSEYPERFSPNVIMRPLYQEILLPNLAYIGGGGELAYWLELKSYFKKSAVLFPILVLRNSVQCVTNKQLKRLHNLDLTLFDVFKKQDYLIRDKVLGNTVSPNFELLKSSLKKQFTSLRESANNTDKSFLGAILAQEKKQINGLNNLEKRWLRAEKRRQKDYIGRISKLQEDILPNFSLEERQRNFATYYEAYGVSFIKKLKAILHPLDTNFIVLNLDDEEIS